MTTGVAAVPAASSRRDASTSSTPAPRWLVALEWTVVVALVALFVARGLVPAWGRLNSDFPNYYLAARLLVARAPLERMYDWIWFQRQKDHAGLDWGIVSYGPLTPFSAMVLAPLAGLPALVAKRCWLVVNLALLAASVALLRAMTTLGLRRVALVTFLTVIPLRTNFDFGQQYVLILFLLVLAGHLHRTGRGPLSGAIVALATVLKIYPAIFVLFFVFKRRWSALAGFAASFGLAVGAGLLSFGVAPLRVYLTSVLPRVSGGEVHDPYYLPLNSLTVLLRRLFVFEPELNPKPLFDATVGYVLLQPIAQALLLVPALWVIARRRREDEDDMLHWGALAALSLVLSTGASTYHFCGLALATVLAVDALVRAGRGGLALLLVLLHALVSAPLYRLVPSAPAGWQVFLGVPRLYALLAYGSLLLHGVTRRAAPRASRLEAPAFCLLFSGVALAGVVANVRHFAGVAKTYASRTGGARGSLLVTTPDPSPTTDYFTRMDDEGYSLDDARGELHSPAQRGRDLLHPAVADDAEDGFVEVSARGSGVARFPLHHGPVVAAELPIAFEDAEQPAVSRDGHWLIFIRQEAGRGGLWLVDVSARGRDDARPSPRRIVDPSYDVLDATVSSSGAIVFSAPADAGESLFAARTSGGNVTPLDVSGRYASLSPDGRSLAYSHEERGAWQIEVMDLDTRRRHRVTHGDCNSLTPAWTSDGARLVYANDCNRGLGATTLCESPPRP